MATSYSITDTPLEIDYEEHDYQGSLSDNSDTTSLKSSLIDYTYENGRRYSQYRDSNYLLPNDQKEQERLDHYHHVWRLLMKGSIYLAPLKDPKRVLDLGTGTGIWAIDFADEFPDCEVEGVDLSPVQPTWVPPNVHFTVDDILDEWRFPKNHFDYIHCRSLVGSIPSWKAHIKTVYEHLKPGGYYELQDCDGKICLYSEDRTYLPTHPLAVVMDLMVRAADKAGQPWQLLPDIFDHFEEVGFELIRHEKLRMPIGPWPKDKYQKMIGAHGIVITKDSIEPHALALLTRVLGMKEEEARQTIYDAINGINSKTHLIMRLEVFVVRKPLNAK